MQLLSTLVDAGQAGEHGSSSLYITLQRKLNRSLLAKYKQWVTDNGRRGNVQDLQCDAPYRGHP